MWQINVWLHECHEAIKSKNVDSLISIKDDSASQLVASKSFLNTEASCYKC